MPPGCCLNSTFRQPATVDALTHASSVIPLVRSSEAASGIVTRLELPLNCSAPPYLPAVDHVAFWTVPSLLLPDESAAFVPLPSSNEYCATSPLAAAVELETFAPTSRTRRAARTASAAAGPAGPVHLGSMPNRSFAEVAVPGHSVPQELARGTSQ